MSSELPPATGRSVFSVFGFGANHYSQDEDFNSPLETAPESFDNSNSLTVTKRKKKIPFQEEPATTFIPEAGMVHMNTDLVKAYKYKTDNNSTTPSHQDNISSPNLPRTMWAFIPGSARKVKINVPDQSSMVVQSFAQTNKHSNTAHPHVPHTYVRRYSNAQEEIDDVVKSSEVLTKFNNTLTQTTYMLTKAAGSNTNIYNTSSDILNDSPTESTSSSKYPALTRVKSSPHLTVGPPFLSTPQKSSLLGSDLISQYMRRNQSQNDLQVVEHNPDSKGDTPTEAIDNTKVIAVPSPLISDTQKPLERDITDTHMPSKSGLGILSKTRQFGAWLTKATEGEKVEVTKKDLNALAPNSF